MDPHFQQDYLLLSDPKNISKGFMVNEFEDRTKGKVIFSLNDLTLGQKYVTTNNNRLERISNIEVRLKGATDAVLIFITSCENEEERHQEIEQLIELKKYQQAVGATMIQTAFRTFVARKKFLQSIHEKKNAPRIVNNDVSITFTKNGNHSDTLTVQYQYIGGQEGETLIQWERPSASSPSQWEAIGGAISKQYNPTVDDISRLIRVTVTPVREDWVKGKPVSSPSSEIKIDPKVQEDVYANLQKRKVQFDASLSCFGREQKSKTVIVHKDRIEIRKKGGLFEETRIRFSSLHSSHVACNHKFPNIFTISSVVTSDSLSYSSYDNRGSIDTQSQNEDNNSVQSPSEIEYKFTVDSRHLRDVIILTIRGRIDGSSGIHDSTSESNYAKGNEEMALGYDEYSLSEGDWQLMLTKANEFTYEKESVIFEQGKLNNSLYRIKSGTVRVIIDTIVVARMGPGSVFGEMSFLGNNVTTASVVADEEVKILELDINSIHKLFEVEEQLSLKFYRNIAIKLSTRLRNLHASAPSGVVGASNRQSIGSSHNSRSNSFGSDSSASSTATVGGVSGSTTPLSTPVVSKVSSTSSSVSSSPSSASLVMDQNPGSRKSVDGMSTIFGKEESERSESEIVIKSYPCTQKNKNGQISIYPHKCTFYAKIFAVKIKKEIQYKDVHDMSKNRETGLRFQLKNKKDIIFKFLSNRERDEFYGLVDHILERASVSPQKDSPSVPLSDRKTVPLRSVQRSISRLPSLDEREQQDWETILAEAERVEFRKNMVILKEGDQYQRLYQIVRGTCRIEKGGEVLGEMADGEVFGEISFLEGKAVSASIVAQSDIVELYLIEGYSLKRLIRHRPALGGRFFKFLASVLEDRLKQRESKLYSHVN